MFAGDSDRLKLVIGLVTSAIVPQIALGAMVFVSLEAAVFVLVGAAALIAAIIVALTILAIVRPSAHRRAEGISFYTRSTYPQTFLILL